jgi:hypothetical protein
MGKPNCTRRSRHGERSPLFGQYQMKRIVSVTEDVVRNRVGSSGIRYSQETCAFAHRVLFGDGESSLSITLIRGVGVDSPDDDVRFSVKPFFLVQFATK